MHLLLMAKTFKWPKINPFTVNTIVFMCAKKITNFTNDVTYDTRHSAHVNDVT